MIRRQLDQEYQKQLRANQESFQGSNQYQYNSIEQISKALSTSQIPKTRTETRGLSVRYSTQIAAELRRLKLQNTKQTIYALLHSDQSFKVFKKNLKKALQFPGIRQFLNSQRLEEGIWASPQKHYQNQLLAVKYIPRLREIMLDPDNFKNWVGRWPNSTKEHLETGHRFRNNSKKKRKPTNPKEENSARRQYETEPFGELPSPPVLFEDDLVQSLFECEYRKSRQGPHTCPPRYQDYYRWVDDSPPLRVEIDIKDKDDELYEVEARQIRNIRQFNGNDEI